VSLLKKGVTILASPLSPCKHDFLRGHVPVGFRTATVIPIHKGKGKKSSDPASYRPVSLLPALSKVFEVGVKGGLVKHLGGVNRLQNSQFGFRIGRSSTSAIVASHGQWHKAARKRTHYGHHGL